MEKPKFVPGKFSKYIKEMNDYVTYMNKNKYNLILEFLNKSCCLKIESLVDFKMIDVERINAKHFSETFDEYKNKLETELEIQITSDKIVDIISTCCDTIGYSVHRTRIVLEKKNRKSSDSSSDSDKIKKKKLFLSISYKPKKEKQSSCKMRDISFNDSDYD